MPWHMPDLRGWLERVHWDTHQLNCKSKVGYNWGSVMIRTSSDLMFEEIVLEKHDEIEWRVSRYDSATCLMKKLIQTRSLIICI